MPTRKGYIINSQGRDLVLQVNKMCELEACRGKLHMPLSYPYKRAACYLGYSEERFKMLLEEMKKTPQNGEPKEAQSDMNGTNTEKHNKLTLNDQDIIKLKGVVQDYYMEHNKIPTFKALLPIVKKEFPTITFTLKSLYQVLKLIGYRKKEISPNKSVLLEDQTFITQRDLYYKNIKQLRSETKSIFYVYERIIDKTLILHKPYRQKFYKNKALYDKNTITFMCAASESGTLKGSSWFSKTEISNGKSKPCGELSTSKFEKWVVDYLVPNLPKSSTVIIGSAPYHCAEADKPIPYYAPRADMVTYLKQKNIDCSADMSRWDLYDFIQNCKPKEKVYVVDKILKDHGHAVLRIPSFLVDLNLLRDAMVKVQDHLKTCNVKIFNLKNVTKAVETAMDTIKQAEWQTFVENVRNAEETYWLKDGKFEDVVDNILQNLETGESSDSDDSDIDDFNADDLDISD